MGMIDRGKVIKGLETIKQFFGYGLPSTAEMFDSYYGILNDALALLKEQEAVKPVEVFRKYTNCHEYHCKKCGNKVGTILGSKHPILPGVKLSIEYFCDVCGQEVKWDE